jgi:hypothetical protein
LCTKRFVRRIYFYQCLFIYTICKRHVERTVSTEHKRVILIQHVIR